MITYTTVILETFTCIYEIFFRTKYIIMLFPFNLIKYLVLIYSIIAIFKVYCERISNNQFTIPMHTNRNNLHLRTNGLLISILKIYIERHKFLVFSF